MFIIIYYKVSDDWLNLQATHNRECDGAVEFGDPYGGVALFKTRGAAQKAIRVSRKFAELKRAQGKTGDLDFLLPCVKSVRVVPCAMAEEAGDA